MTPLCHRLARDLMLPLKERKGNDKADLLHKLSDVHCFDVSAIFEMAVDLASRIDDASVASSDYLTFLPAPKTWIEIAGAGKPRLAYLLCERPDKRAAEVYFVTDFVSGFPEGFYSTHRLPDIALARPHLVGQETETHGARIEEIMGFKEQALLYAVLLSINSPKVIGRRTHQPHAGLQRKLAKKFGGIGKFPLHAWTEVLLHVSTRDATSEPMEEGHLTGRRALHWVRTFGRIRLGRLEIVRSHWRGDAALGIKQSRYTVKP